MSRLGTSTSISLEKNDNEAKNNNAELKQLSGEIAARLQVILDQDQSVANAYLALESGMRALMGQLNIPIHDRSDVTRFSRERILAALVAG